MPSGSLGPVGHLPKGYELAMPQPSPVDTDLLSCFYEGISQPRRLAQGLRRLAELLACERVSLQIWDRRGHWSCLAQAAHEAGQWKLLVNDGEPPEPVLRALVAKFEPGLWKRLERLQAASLAGAIPHATGFIPAGQVAYSTRMPLPQAEALLSLHRQDSEWPDMPSRLALATHACRLLLPALEPIACLKQLSRQCAHLSAMLNGIGMPMLLLDTALRPLAANASATALFRLSARTSLGRMVVALPGVPASRFAQLVERACSARASGGVIEFSAPNASAVTHLFILPVTVSSAGAAQAAALVLALVQGGECMSDEALQILQHAYRLTPAEARLAQRILDGQSPGQVAAALQVSVSTIRTQLSSILKKTGAQRQSDLVRRLSPLLLLNHASGSR